MNTIRIALIQHPRLVWYATLVMIIVMLAVLQVGVVSANDPLPCPGLGCG